MSEALQSSVAARTNQGVLVQARVQPDTVGLLANRMLKMCAGALQVSQGQVMGVMLLVAFSQAGLLFSTLEEAYAKALDDDSLAVWAMVRDQLAKNPLLSSDLDASAAGDAP
jgi:hypothetical protein